MSLFDNAKTIAAPAPAKKGKAKTERIIPGIEHLAMIDALMKSLDTMKGSIEAGVKSAALDAFMEHIEATGMRPESFKGIEGGASASCELRKRASNHPLNEAQIELLRKHGIEPQRDELIPEMFGINPTYSGNADLLGKVSEAIASIVPADFIVKQEGRYKFIVSDAMLVQACHDKKPVEVISSLTVLATKPRLQTTNLAAILDFVRGLVADPVAFGAAANDAAAEKERAA